MSTQQLKIARVLSAQLISESCLDSKARTSLFDSAKVCVTRTGIVSENFEARFTLADTFCVCVDC